MWMAAHTLAVTQPNMFSDLANTPLFVPLRMIQLQVVMNLRPQTINRTNHCLTLWKGSWVPTLCILFLQFQHSLSNTCIDSLLKATHTFLEMIVRVSTSDSSLTNIASAFPRSLYRLKSWFHVPKLTFLEYAVCPTCGWVYEGDTCKRLHDAPFFCTNTQFPNHPHESWTQQCRTPLTRISLTSVRPRTRVKLLQTLCYNPIADQLANLLRWFDKELDARPLADVSSDAPLFDVQDSQVHT